MRGIQMQTDLVFHSYIFSVAVLVQSGLLRAGVARVARAPDDSDAHAQTPRSRRSIGPWPGTPSASALCEVINKNWSEFFRRPEEQPLRTLRISSRKSTTPACRMSPATWVAAATTAVTVAKGAAIPAVAAPRCGRNPRPLPSLGPSPCPIRLRRESPLPSLRPSPCPRRLRRPRPCQGLTRDPFLVPHVPRHADERHELAHIYGSILTGRTPTPAHDLLPRPCRQTPTPAPRRRPCPA